MVTDQRRCELLQTYFGQRVSEILSTYSAEPPDDRQRLSRERLKLALSTICAHFPEGASVLDIGSGCGLGAATLGELGYDVTAVELIPELVEQAKNRTESAVNWVEGPFQDSVAKKGSFDVVMALGYLEYQERAGKELVKMRRMLKPGGVLLLSVPNTISAQFKFGLDRAIYRMTHEPEKIPVRHSFTPERLQRLLGMAGFILNDYVWLPDGEGGKPLSMERGRDFWEHRVRWRTAPEFFSLSRTYRPEDTAV